MSDEIPSYEECFVCDDLTGRAGQGEDSLYCDECDKGPYCPDCFRKHHESDVKVAKLEAKNEMLGNALAAAQVFAIELKEGFAELNDAHNVTNLVLHELEAENEALKKIKRATKLYLEHGEPELADELDALLTGVD